MSGAVLPILFALLLIGCSSGLSEAEKRNKAGVELQKEGRLEEAIAQYGEAIRLDPKLILTYDNRGAALLILGAYQRAIDDYDEVIHLDPALAHAYGNRAIAYTFIGKDKEAQQDVDQAVGLGFDRGKLNSTIEEIKKQRYGGSMNRSG